MPHRNYSLPSPPPPPSFISRAAKTGLSLLRNQMETLATQASSQTLYFLFKVRRAREPREIY